MSQQLPHSQKSIRKLMVANRGEIAVRIFRTCRRLGIKTVAVYSEADKRSLHVRCADEAVCVGGSEPQQSYLSISKLVAAIASTGTDAVHPGYGFLAENSEFSRAVEESGALFLGPTAAQMNALGDKEQAKVAARNLAIPVLESERVTNALPNMPCPLVIKARAGGGGRGMRIVRSEAEFAPAVQSASREALAFFGDGTLFVERFIERARHVEVQLLGDGTGDVRAIGDRDCTVQRKHQKVLEEAPAFGLSAELRKKLHSDSERLLSSVKYRGAGTAEFLVCGEQYFFLEVNTRLQVEHPVTEAVTGLDLVELQIRIANGERLTDLLPGSIPLDGSAIELRLCAERPAENFAPATGTIAAVFAPRDVRFDCGFEALDSVSHYYDSLLGKIIVKGDTRAEAIRNAIAVIHQPIVLGVDTNQAFLTQILTHPEYIEAQHFTRWVDSFTRPSEPSFESAVLACSPSPAVEANRVGFAERRIYLESVKNDGSSPERVEVIGAPPSLIQTGRGMFLFYEGKGYPVTVSYPALRSRDSGGQKNHSSGTVHSPLPGKILDLKVNPGSSVAKGEVLMVLESMKMEHPIKAPISGILKRMCVASQQVVEAGTIVAEVEG